MKYKKVSIIIPVYNNEKFLEKCLTSVLNQTLKDIEIIIINDGSTDGSLAILENYQNMNPNIILVNQPNAGQAVAINRALDLACGEYVAFVDADDYVEPHMMETLYQEAKANNLDLVICNFSKVDTQGKLLSYHDHSNFEHKILERNQVIREFLLNRKELVEGFSWNKLIKLSLFKDFNIRYPNIKYEDIPTIFSILTKINRCKYINDNLYYYVQHAGSITNTKNKENIIGFIDSIEMIQDILIKENLLFEFADEYFVYKINNLLSKYTSSIEIINESEELTKTYQYIFQSIRIKKLLKLNRQLDLKFCIKIFLCKVNLLSQFVTAYQKLKAILN